MRFAFGFVAASTTCALDLLLRDRRRWRCRKTAEQVKKRAQETRHILTGREGKQTGNLLKSIRRRKIDKTA